MRQDKKNKDIVDKCDCHNANILKMGSLILVLIAQFRVFVSFVEFKFLGI